MNESERVACRRLAKRIRQHCLRMTHRGKSGHVGSMLSMADILSVLYLRILKVNPERTDDPNRDRFILSKGHGGAAVYAVLAELGFFPKDWLETYYQDNGKLMGHISHHVPGVEFSTGSLGHGLSVATGMALAAKQKGQTHRVVCLMSDGDCNEGSTWEAVMFAAQHKFDNLTVIVDYNRVQALGLMENVIEMEPFGEKLRAFGWSVRTVDGHDHEAIEQALRELPFEKGKPSWLLAKTVKGKPVSWMEGTVACHYGAVNDEQLSLALAEVEAKS
jgi:transketolase